MNKYVLPLILTYRFRWRVPVKAVLVWPAIVGFLLCWTGCDNQDVATVNGLPRPVSVMSETAPNFSAVLNDAEKQTAILNIIEVFVPHAIRFRRGSDLKETRTDWYDADGPGVTQPRGAGNLAFAFATLLQARPNASEIGGVPRGVLIEDIIQTIRHEALTSSLSGAGYNRWGNGTWQASLETYSWGFAAWLLWDSLDDETRTLVETVVTREADILITKPIASGEEGDSGAEDNAWNAPTPALASVMFPLHRNADTWRQTAIRLALNASSTEADATSSEVIDGAPLSQWMSSVNLHPDLTLENHGFFNPVYQQVTHVNTGDAALMYQVAGIPLPEAVSFRAETVWESVLMRLASDDGDLIMPAGQDWTSKDYQHLSYLSILATRFGRVDASVYESRAIETIGARQAATGNGAILGQPDLGYETMLVKRLAAAWWHHRLSGPSPEFDEAAFVAQRQSASGVKVFPHSDFIAARMEKAFVSMSWDSNRPMGLVVPNGPAEDAVFSYYAPGSLVGDVVGQVRHHTCKCGETGFSTAGLIGEKQFSMTAFEDGTVILLDVGQGRTFTYALESIPGVTGERPVYSADGEGVGNLNGSWVNVADRLGMVVLGGAGISVQSAGGTSGGIEIIGSNGTGTGNRAAMLLPLADAETTAMRADTAVQPDVPDGWVSLAGRAADGSLRLAAARFGGPAVADVTLSDPRGAPAPEGYSELSGDAVTFQMRLAPTSSVGETMRFFVSAKESLRAFGEKLGENESRVFIGNPGMRTVPLTIQYVSDKGETQQVESILYPGQGAWASVLNGQLVFTGQAFAPIDAAHELLTQALESVTASLNTAEAACADTGQCDNGSLKRLAQGLDRLVNKTQDAKAAVLQNDRYPDRNLQGALRVLDAVVQRAAFDRIPEELALMVESALEEARQQLSQALTMTTAVEVWLAPLSSAMPGELLQVQAVMHNPAREMAHDGELTVSSAQGSGAVATAAFSCLMPRTGTVVNLAMAVPQDVIPGSLHALWAKLTARTGTAQTTSTDTLNITVDDAVTIIPLTAKIPLADGGVNFVAFEVTNYTEREMNVSVEAVLPDGALLNGNIDDVTLPAKESEQIIISVKGDDRISGEDNFFVTARADTGTTATAQVQVQFSDDLAFNPGWSPFPQPFADSHQADYPPVLVQDGNNETFWVSGGTVSGQGPTPESPEIIGVDFGGEVRVGKVTMVPRIGYGPDAYTIEISSDGDNWTPVAEEPAAVNNTITTTFPPVTARMIRLVIKGSHDWQQPPRNVQIRSFIVQPPDNDLAQNPWGAEWPRGYADSAQSGYPVTNAFDANDETFWVSGGVVSGDGPTIENLESLYVDFGEIKEVAAITVVPRSGYGPTAYRIEVSVGDNIWTPVVSVPDAPNSTHKTVFTPILARLLRIVITGSYDWQQPPRNVQLRTFMVHAP